MTTPQQGSVASDIITWVRRIIKSPSDAQITDATILQYVNRAYTYDIPARIQQFELKRQYTFETLPNTFIYQFPYNSYQLAQPPIYCDGVQIGYFENNQPFYNLYPEFVQNEQPFNGNGTVGPYKTQFGTTLFPGPPSSPTISPILSGFTDDLGNLEPYVFITAEDAGGTMHYIVDNGKGILIETDATFQNVLNATAGTVNYLTASAEFTFLTPIPSTSVIGTQTSPYSPGVPRMLLFFNNTIKLYPVPDRPYKIQMDVYVTPAQFLESQDAVPFSYMAEYIAVAAARKILRDNADFDQFQFYTDQLREMECQVLRRSNRQTSTQRTPTIFSGQLEGQQNQFYTQY